MHWKPGFALLGAVIFVVGCKHHLRKAAPTPHIPITDACDALTQADISAVLGVPINPGLHPINGTKVLCDWSQTGIAGDEAEKVALHFISLDGFKGEKIAAGDIRVAPAPGIGDDAIYVVTRLGTSLLLRKGNTAVGFSLINLPLSADEIMAKEKALGLAAAARL